jgi:hypothetical protein
MGRREAFGLVARRSVDREIGYPEEFGPEFFHIRSRYLGLL